MSVRLKNVISKLKVSLERIDIFLAKKGNPLKDVSPNASISDEQLKLLVDEFGKNTYSSFQENVLNGANTGSPEDKVRLPKDEESNGKEIQTKPSSSPNKNSNEYYHILAMIGSVKWYDLEKGFGVLESIDDQFPYFIHHSKLDNLCKKNLSEEDVVLFTPSFDQKRYRFSAVDIRYATNSQSIIWILNEWLNNHYILDEHINKILSIYLKISHKEKTDIFYKKYDSLLSWIISWMIESKKSEIIYTILKQAISSFFTQDINGQLIEKAEIKMIKRLPSELCTFLLDKTNSPYVCFEFAFFKPELTKIAVDKAFMVSKKTTSLLDDLIRFVKTENNQEIQNLLDNNKSLIANKSFWSGINGDSIISSTIDQLFSTIIPNDLVSIYHLGYITDIDNHDLQESNPDCFKVLKIHFFKNCQASHIDTDFIKDNIKAFYVNDLTRIRHYYNLSEEDALNVYLSKVKSIINSGTNDFGSILILSSDLPQHSDWILENHEFLSSDSFDNYQNLKIWLYKNNLYQDLDENFVIYYIDRFSVDDVIKIIRREGIPSMRIMKILNAEFKCLMGDKEQLGIQTSPLQKTISQLKDLMISARMVLKDQYSQWTLDLFEGLNIEEQYIYWKEDVFQFYPSSYIHERLLSSSEVGYKEFYDLFLHHRISILTACNDLWTILNENQKVNNRPEFYKILYCIKYLLLINPQYKEALEQNNNDYYNLVLWFLHLKNDFDFDLLSRLFIYFEPQSQVRILKYLFYLTEIGSIELTIEKLNKLTRVDADLFRSISVDHPDTLIDISTEIVIKAITDFSQRGFFSSDRDVLDIVINRGLYNRKNYPKIGCYFDECKGRLSLRRNGSKKRRGNIIPINGNQFAVFVDAYVNQRVYTRGMGYRDERVVNDKFHDIVNAIKKISGHRLNTHESYWEIDSEYKEELLDIAIEYGLTFEGTDNAHMYVYETYIGSTPSEIKFCEGRPAQRRDERVGRNFLWCRNSKCFNDTVAFHNKECWEQYTLLDFF